MAGWVGSKNKLSYLSLMENRRVHLKKLMLGAPLAVSSLGWLSNCKKEDLLDGANFNGKVLIIGAGASGVYAAELLLRKGVDVQILEASSRAGGRIQSADIPGIGKLELGAEFIHGSRSIFYDMALSQGADSLMPDEGEDLYWLENQIRDEKYMRESPTLNGGGQTLFQIVDSLGSYPGGDQSLLQYLTDFPLEQPLFPIANALIANDYGSDLASIGMFALRDAEAGFSSGLENYRLKQSIWSLFEKKCPNALSKILFNQEVVQVNYSSSGVSVETAGGAVYNADRVLITVPLTILRANRIAFEPALPAEKQNAINNIKMDGGSKYFMRFSGPFWPDDTASIIGGQVIPEYWVIPEKDVNEAPGLTAFVTGPLQEQLRVLPEIEQRNLILAELAAMFPSENVVSALTSFYVKDWSAEPFIGGAYSYPSLLSAGQREPLAAPVSDRVFFAGEATNFNGHQGTVHGAMESGYRAVLEILKS